MNKYLVVFALVCLLTPLSKPLMAGAKFEINEDFTIDLGFRLQTLYLSTEKDMDDDGYFDTYSEFKVRRGRIRLKGYVTDTFFVFLQTELTGTDGTGLDVRMVDAYIKTKFTPMFELITGLNLAPSSRQNLTSSGALLCLDRPGMVYKSLTWGTRSLYALANKTFSDADAGLRGDVAVRDLGATLFGATDFSDDFHFKYYLAVNEGVQPADKDNKRYTGRVQFNIWDAEGGYYNSATYLGKKKTIGIGVSLDSQKCVELGSESEGIADMDYQFYTVDVFAELPFGESNCFTLEAAYENLDLNDISTVLNSQGNGYYVQAAVLFGKWQPWVLYEKWDSDCPSGTGTYDSYRVGMSYYLLGHNAAIKIGYEQWNAETTIGSTMEDSITSIAAGIYITY